MLQLSLVQAFLGALAMLAYLKVVTPVPALLLRQSVSIAIQSLVPLRLVVWHVDATGAPQLALAYLGALLLKKMAITWWERQLLLPRVGQLT